MKAGKESKVDMRQAGSRLLRVAMILASVSSKALAGDIYVVRFFTPLTSASTEECLVVGWRDHLLFRNSTTEALTVRPLGGSNGYSPPMSDALLVPAGRSQSVMISPGDEIAISNQWTPVGSYVFMINHLDVPEGVLVESRTEIYGTASSGMPLPCSPLAGGTPVFGSVPLPVVRALTPAGVPQFHLRTDVGTLNSRTNVGIYNDSSVEATASIEVREACDDRVLDSRLAAIPPKSVVQITGFANALLTSRCGGAQGAPIYVRYVVVTMNQPGFSFVTSLASDLPPKVAITSSAR
jgi:hypothetical protein